jgi:hypothetical protein
MTPSNTPNSGTPKNSEKQKENKNGKSIESLIKKVSTWKSGGFDPYIRNRLDNSIDSRKKMIAEIRESMRASFDEEEYGFEKDVINSLSDGELRWYLEKYSRNLVALRKNTPKVIHRYFPDVQIDQRSLDADIMEYSEREIENILENSANIKKYLREVLKVDTAELTPWKPKLRELFEIENMPEWDFKNRLEKAIKRFELSNVSFDRDLIREVIGYYDQDHEKIEKIAKEFHLTISISDAIRSWMISTEDVDRFTENLYSEIWEWLSDEQKNQFKIEARKDDFLKFSFEELKQIRQEFSKNYSTKKFKDRFTSQLSSRFREFISDAGRPSLTTTFEEFTDKIINGQTKIHIHPIHELQEWSIMVCRDRWAKMRFIKIEKIDEELKLKDGVAGMTLSFLDGISEGTIGQPKWKSTLSYENVEERLAQMDDIQVMSESDLRSQISGGMFQDEHGQIIRDASIEEDEYSMEYLENKLDSVDEKWKGIKMEKWMVFSARVDITDKKWKTSKTDQSFTVLKVDSTNKTIVFSNSQEVEQASFYEFAKVIEWGINFRRIAILKSDGDFFHALSNLVEDFPSHVHIKDGKFVPDDTEKHDDHGWDDHGHGDHAKNPTIEYFKTGEGDGHIRLFEIGNDLVSFGAYDPPSDVNLDKIRAAKGAKKLPKNKEKWFYSLRTMTRAQFLVYLKDNKYKATTEDLFDPHAWYHPHDPHMHGGGLMWLFKWPSINDIFKGFSNIAHGIEHYFEKNSKLNASRFALKVGRKFGFPVDIMAQLQADEVSSMKEVIEKIWDKLNNLNWPVGREKALHIAELTSSSAEEVGAAMLHMVKWYGHLYAEDIAYAHGSESFINGFLYSLGWKWAELTRMKREARSKYLADLGSGSDGGEPTEEEIIWWLLKIIDGGAGRKKGDPKYDPRFANAGAVVKAMGGPSGWEKAWRTEGIKNAYDKGIRQGTDVVNAEWRVNKWLSALKTFELNTAMGFMEKAAGKTPHPSIQTIPVVWALGWYSKHCSTAMQQKVKWYGDSQGHTFHAYSFLRNAWDNDIYTKAFIKALRDIDPGVADTAEKAIQTIRLDPLGKKEKKKKEAYEGAIDTIADIWKRFQWVGLHDHLQGKSTWMIRKINEWDQDVKKYAEKFAEKHKENGNEKPPSNDNDWNQQYGVTMSGMFGDNKGNATKEQDGKKVLSLAATLNKLSMNRYELNKDDFDRLWPLILGHFEKLESESDPELQKAQYKQFREDIITRFRNGMGISSGGKAAAIDEVQRKEYYKWLRYMWIEAEELFVSTPIHIKADAGYSAWKSGKWKWTSSWTQTVWDWVKQKTSSNLKR